MANKTWSSAQKGTYSAGTSYTIGDFVVYNGSSYTCIANSTGNLPTNATYWALIVSKGDTGDTGETGATGSQGEQGEQGDKGDKGDKGDTGSTGETGATGASIVSAEFDGDDIKFTKDDTSTVTLEDAKIELKGDKGDDGDKGDKGDQGDQGVQGAQGAQGDKGDEGDKGDKGDQGEQGEQGIQGVQGTAGTNGTDGLDITWEGAYAGGTTYAVNDAVSYNGSSYICKLESTGNLPTNSTYWDLMAQKGSDGTGSGDMLKATYDPDSIEGDAFDMDNMVEGTTNKLVSSAEKSTWNGKQDALGFTAENSANKKTDLSDNSDTYYPSQKAVKTAVDAKQATLVSGTNIKTINSTTLLGSGDIAITVPTKASGSELDTGTDDAKFATAKALADSNYKKLSELVNIQSTADASSITPTGNYRENEYYVTALAQALTINEPSGTPANGNTVLFRIKDNGTSRTLTWNAAYTWIGTTKPEATVISKVLYVAGIYNSTSEKWEMTGLTKEA